MARYRDEVSRYGQVTAAYGEPAALTEANIATYRTPDYMLSCVQDYRAGKPGCQQHIWQATLGIDAVVFTNHPGTPDESNCVASQLLGRQRRPAAAAQHENIAVCIHRLPAGDPLPFSHAYVPRHAFDEIVERNGWLCARKGGGYLALYSEHPMLRSEHDDEARAAAADNVWICELGHRSGSGSFGRFVSEVSSADVYCSGQGVSYQSPAQGLVEFGWDNPLRVGGATVPLRGYKRFDNAYCRCEFGQTAMTIRSQDEAQDLNFEAS